jgi:soluble lytic murein transglycosylase
MHLIDKGGERGIVEDALWQYAWFQVRTDERGRAIDTFGELVDRFPDTGYRPAGLFWIGKLALETGQGEQAVGSWQLAAAEGPYGYYGYRSREMLSVVDAEPTSVGSQAVFPEVDSLSEPRGRYHYDLAVMLKQVGLYEFAADQLEADLAGRGDPGLRFAIADLRAAAGRGTQAFREIRETFGEYIRAGGHNIPEDFWRVVFPLHHWPLITEEAARYGIDPWLAAALIRNESMFNSYATSPAGAIGLMQVMPATAAIVARDLGLPAPTEADLYDPVLNIRLGMYYLHERVKEFDGDLIRAVCSYNAGVGPVREWTRRNRVDDMDEWIELIPYTETRLYIKAVLGDLREYRRIYG